jgi:hypothetical protein
MLILRCTVNKTYKKKGGASLWLLRSVRSFLVRFLLFAGSLSSLPADAPKERQSRQHSVNFGIIMAEAIKVVVLRL